MRLWGCGQRTLSRQKDCHTNYGHVLGEPRKTPSFSWLQLIYHEKLGPRPQHLLCSVLLSHFWAVKTKNPRLGPPRQKRCYGPARTVCSWSERRMPQCSVGSGVSGKHGLGACSREGPEVKASQEGSTAIWGPELSRGRNEDSGNTGRFFLVSSLGHSACGHQLLAMCRKNRGPSFLELKVKEMRPLRVTWLGQRISSPRRLLRASAKLALRVKGSKWS